MPITGSLDDLIQVLQQIASIGAVLGGVAVSLFVGLLPMGAGRRMASISAVSASLAATLLAVATVAGVSGISSWRRW